MTDDEIFGLSGQRELASVCRKWRDVVLSAPQFLNAVTDDAEVGNPLLIVPVKVRRFKDTLLPVEYLDEPTDPESGVWDLLQSTASRWKEATLNLVWNHSKLNATLEQGMPNLGRLTLLSDFFTNEVKFGPTPRLEELRLSLNTSLDIISGTTLSYGSLQEAPHRTGTLPFMAIGLLEEPKSEHRIGFDVEALIWTLLWIVRLYDNGKAADLPLNEHPLKNWFLYPESLKTLAASKTQYLSNSPKHRFTNTFNKDLEDEMKGLARKWSKMLTQQGDERQEHEEEVWFSEGLYGAEGFDEIQAWMVEHKWNKYERCSCGRHRAL